MEQMVNRRRVMGGGKEPYLEFEDSLVWRICCINWGDYNEVVVTDNGDNTVNITTTFKSMLNNTVKRRRVVSVENNVDNTEGIYIVGTTKTPIGITAKQCKSVVPASATNLNRSRLASTFIDAGLPSGKPFNELRYFEGWQNFYCANKYNGGFSKLKLPSTIKSMLYQDNGIFGNCDILDFPPAVSSIDGYFWLRVRVNTLILRSPRIVSAGSSYFSQDTVKKELYVPSELVDAYKNNSVWGKLNHNKILPIEGSKYEVFNEWNYDN